MSPVRHLLLLLLLDMRVNKQNRSGLVTRRNGLVTKRPRQKGPDITAQKVWPRQVLGPVKATGPTCRGHTVGAVMSWLFCRGRFITGRYDGVPIKCFIFPVLSVSNADI